MFCMTPKALTEKEKVASKKLGDSLSLLPPTAATSLSFRQANGEFQVANVAAFEAASREISQIIDAKGSISSVKCAQIMQQKNHLVELLNEQLPHSYSTSEVLERVMDVLRSRNYTPHNTLLAHSVCPCAINHEPGSITNVFAKHMGDDVFQLGGLAGIPFTGKAGFNGFCHQAPDNGHCFVLLAPHVGMDSDGTLGRCDRSAEVNDSPDQPRRRNSNESFESNEYTCSSCSSSPSTTAPCSGGPTCAAAIDAFNLCCTHGGQYPGLPSIPGNVELTYLLHQMGPRHKLILADSQNDNALHAELAHHCHEIAKGMLDTVLHTDFGGPQSTLVVLTGIQINMPAPFEDFFQPLSFYVIDKIGRKRDLFLQTFGHWSPLQQRLKEKSTLMFCWS